MVSHYYENIFVDILDALHFDLILEEGSPIPSSFFSVIFSINFDNFGAHCAEFLLNFLKHSKFFPFLKDFWGIMAIWTRIFGTPCVYSLFLATSRIRGADECCPVWGKVETFYCGYCDAAPRLDQDCVWTSTSQHNPSPGHWNITISLFMSRPGIHRYNLWVSSSCSACSLQLIWSDLLFYCFVNCAFCLMLWCGWREFYSQKLTFVFIKISEISFMSQIQQLALYLCPEWGRVYHSIFTRSEQF